LVDIIITRSNSVIYDPRVRKTARSLSKRYSISILGWNRDRVSKKELTDNYIVDLKLFNLKSPPIGKWYVIAYWPLFWMWILINLFVYRPKVVHACDLDTVLPCYIYKLIFRKRFVFDAYERYAMAYFPYFPLKLKALYSLVNLFEELFSKKADVLIVVNEKALRTFRRTPKYCAIIMNCPEDYTIGKTKSEYNDVFTLVFTGAIVRNRGFEPIIAAIKDLNDVEFVVAGKVIHKELLDQMQVLSNVTYKGFLSNEDVLALEGHSDAMVVLYDSKVPQNDFVSPNKFFEAMMFRVPIITNLAPELINDEVGCGIIVDYNNVNQIREAIVRLRDNKELCRRLGNNGRNAYLQKYNWKIMEEELYKIYKYLLGY